MLQRQAIAFIMFLLIKTSLFAQAPGAKQVVKSTAAKGELVADMDCSVKLNGSPKLIALKANTPLTVNFKKGENRIEALTEDKKSNLKITAQGVAGEVTQVQISFFDDSRFPEYIKQGNMEMIEMAVKKDPGLINNKGGVLVTSPLEMAILNSQPEAVKFFLENGASYTKPKNIYPLHKSIMFASSVKSTKNKKMAADSILVDLFLSKGCDVNEKDEAGNTPLHCAAQYGKADLAATLVEKGADLNAKNTAGDTPLKLAENKGHVSIIDYLKSKGALEK